MTDLITITEAIPALRERGHLIHRTAIARMCARGVIPDAVMINGAWRVNLEKLLDIMEKYVPGTIPNKFSGGKMVLTKDNIASEEDGSDDATEPAKRRDTTIFFNHPTVPRDVVEANLRRLDEIAAKANCAIVLSASGTPIGILQRKPETSQ